MESWDFDIQQPVFQRVYWKSTLDIVLGPDLIHVVYPWVKISNVAPNNMKDELSHELHKDEDILWHKSSMFES